MMTSSGSIHRRSFLSPTLVMVLAVLTLAGTACSPKTDALAEPDAQELVGLLMPERIKIVEAFTTFKSFDEDNVPDGVVLMVQPLDFYGDPVKIAGTVRAELYTFVPASAMQEGAPICDPWQISIASEHDQRKYWNVVTSMYEFPLELPAGLTPSGTKYVLRVVYTTPLSTHLSDELTLSLPQLTGPADEGVRP